MGWICSGVVVVGLLWTFQIWVVKLGFKLDVAIVVADLRLEREREE